MRCVSMRWCVFLLFRMIPDSKKLDKWYLGLLILQHINFNTLVMKATIQVTKNNGKGGLVAVTIPAGMTGREYAAMKRHNEKAFQAAKVAAAGGERVTMELTYTLDSVPASPDQVSNEGDEPG